MESFATAKGEVWPGFLSGSRMRDRRNGNGCPSQRVGEEGEVEELREQLYVEVRKREGGWGWGAH